VSRWGAYAPCAPGAGQTIQRLREGRILLCDRTGSAEMSASGRATIRGRRENEVPFGSPAPLFEGGGKSAKGRRGIHPQVPAGTYFLRLKNGRVRSPWIR